MSRVVITAPAKRDLKEINSFIARNNPDAARRLKERIRQQCQVLATFPEMGRSWDDLIPPLRSFPVSSYLIFYRPIETGIEVVRVVSGYRDFEALFPERDDN